MLAENRRKISRVVLAAILGSVLFLMIFSFQQIFRPSKNVKMPLTIQEQLEQFMPEGETVLDNRNPNNVLLFWKDVLINMGP
ncbi:MAG: hypothetical protein WC838_05495, partial [Candidatus Margulisiibacteriota bacterium]